MDVLFFSSSPSSSSSNKSPAEAKKRRQQERNEAMVRETILDLRAAERELNRERGHLEESTRQDEQAMKKTAQDGRMELVKLQVKGIVKKRQQTAQLMRFEQNVQLLQSRTKQMQVTNKISDAMRSVTNAMTRVGSTMNLDAVLKAVSTFNAECSSVDQKMKAIEEALNPPNQTEDEEAQRLEQAVLDELGIDLSARLGAQASTMPTKTATNSSSEMDEIERRFLALK